MPKQTNIWYNKTNSCERCGKELKPRNALREKNSNGDWTGKWICNRCSCNNYYHNIGSPIKKSLTGCRSGILHPNSEVVKGTITQIVINKLRGLNDLNKVNDSFNNLIDSIDPITGFKYQIQGRRYNSRYKYWHITCLEREWHKEFSSMFCCCFNEDGSTINRIYEFPKDIIIGRKTFAIYENNIFGWYEKYRITDKEITKANDILKDVLRR